MTQKKVSTNLPDSLLKEACKVSGLNQTDALKEGLRQLIRYFGRKELVEMKGRFHFDQAKISRERVKL
jgi:hypothetical protein